MYPPDREFLDLKKIFFITISMNLHKTQTNFLYT